MAAPLTGKVALAPARAWRYLVEVQDAGKPPNPAAYR
jgi:hypothetical protein